MHIILILLIMAVVLAALTIIIYNQLVGLRQMAMNGWADIAVQLKRRADLIPQLVNTVKAYAAHENKLFDDVTRRRMEALGAGDNPAARGAAETALSAPVSRLLAIAEDYPDLKASLISTLMSLAVKSAVHIESQKKARHLTTFARRTSLLRFWRMKSFCCIGSLRKRTR